jgi:4-alpha-glucanotransferase
VRPNIDSEAWGIQRTYLDHRDHECHAPDASISSLLEAMGADTVRPLPAPLIVISQLEGLRPSRPGEIQLENGDTLPIEPGRTVRPPLGYHNLIHGDEAVRLIVGPGRCYLPRDARAWGWEIELFALRSRNSWGIGDLADLRRAAQWSTELGAGAALLTPLHAVAPGLPQQASPYFPSSRCFCNPLYLCVEEIPGAREAGLDLDSIAASARALNASRLIERDAVYEAKLAALELLWDRFQGDDAFERFRTERGTSLNRFATFCALYERHNAPPTRWPEEYRRPDSPSVRRFARDNDRRIRFHEWLQWLLDMQLSSAAVHIELIHDLAIGVDPCGADAWIWQDSFTKGVTVGAPPDPYNASGQDWGALPLNPWELRSAAYEPFIQTVRASLRKGAGLRFDHVMGLWRLFWIPSGASPAHGAYVRYPSNELLEILALESVRAGAFIVGEDLGTVEPDVRAEMTRRDMLSYRLLWFEPTRPADYPSNALAAVTNHDLPTIPGLWTRADPQEQQAMGLEVDQEFIETIRQLLISHAGVDADAAVDEVVDATYRALARAPSRLLIAMLEDALRVMERQNHPGTLDEWPNWCLALPKSLEEIEADQRVGRIATLLNRDA